MGIMLVVDYQCDRCGMDEWDSPPLYKVVKKLRAEGWRIGKETICPWCLDGTAED